MLAMAVFIAALLLAGAIVDLRKATVVTLFLFGNMAAGVWLRHTDMKSIARSELAERFGGIVATALGMVLAVTPVVLWIAWTASLVLWIMLGAAVCAVLLALLESSLPSARGQRDAAGTGGRVILPEEFIEEVHRLFPLTYHHSRLETTRFRRAMKRMSQMIADSKPGDMPR